jgi:hypothetical protein
MHCRSCDALLTDFETSRRSLVTGDYIELCQQCFTEIKGDCLAFGNPSLIGDNEDFMLEHQDIDALFDEDTDEWDSR